MRMPEDWSKIVDFDPDYVAFLRSKTPAEKFEMVFAANRTARILAANGIRQQHPQWNEEEVQREVARLMLSGEIEDMICRE